LKDGGTRSRKNLIINGGFDIWQRGTSFTELSTYLYAADRWKYAGTITATCTKSLLNGIPTLTLTSNNNAGDAVIQLMQILEESTYKKLQGKSVTLSAYIKSNIPSACVYINVDGGTSYFSLAHGGDESWKRLYVTVNLPSTIASSLNCYLGSYRGETNTLSNGDYVEVSNVQLEAGEYATDFEYRPIAEELALCQRYYEKNYPQSIAPGTSGVFDGIALGIAVANNSVVLSCPFKVSKRISPTIVIYSRNGTAGKVSSVSTGDDVGTSVVVAFDGETGFYWAYDTAGNSFTVGTEAYELFYTADAEL
jgi:hypothetical protein